MKPSSANVYEGVPAVLPAELVEDLLRTESFRLERIVSRGHSTPAGDWYDQVQHEWVVVLRGAARLRFEGRDDPLTLRTGDHLVIPAHVRHRVEWTDPTAETVWLALHYS